MSKRERAYWPEVVCISPRISFEGERYVSLETWVRLKHTDGKWYDTMIYADGTDYLEIWKRFIYDAVHMEKLGIVSLDIETVVPPVRKVFELSESQLDEPERLLEIMKKNGLR